MARPAAPREGLSRRRHVTRRRHVVVHEPPSKLGGIRDRIKIASAALTDFRSVIRVLLECEPDEIWLTRRADVGRSVLRPTRRGTGEHRVRHAGTSRGHSYAQAARAFITLVRANASATSWAKPPTRTRRSTAQPLRRRQGGGLLAGEQLSRGLRDSRLLGHPFQSRVAAAPGAVRHAEGRRRGVPDRRWQRGAPFKLGDFVDSPRLGVGAGVRRGDVAHAADRRARGLRHLHRRDESPLGVRRGGLRRRRPSSERPRRPGRSLFRPADLRSSIGSPAKARERLGWAATLKMRDVVHAMVAARRSARPA